MLDAISQIVIFVFGFLAIVLVAKKNRWGFVFGFLSQPFWLYTAYAHRQWGVALSAALYTASWAYGIYEWFFKNKRETTR